MELLTITTLRQATLQSRLRAGVQGQVETLAKKETKDGKPFFELGLKDGEAKLTLRAWSDSPGFKACLGIQPNAFLEITGEFFTGSFGVESKDWQCRELEPAERLALLAGPPELRAKQAADYAFIEQAVDETSDPRLRGLGRLFLADHGERFQRTAAARFNHHARRGGLVEHTAQMMRSALAVCSVYPSLNRDLMAAGVLFHDCGKLWENVLPADGFVMDYTERAELLGHIPIGIELVNALWRKLMATPEAQPWAKLKPDAEQVRLHLLHLVAAHHGELQFGSPVVPKTPEAWALHYVDNLDAKVEMMMHGYANSKTIGTRVYEKAWPLPANSVEPLPAYAEPADA